MFSFDAIIHSRVGDVKYHNWFDHYTFAAAQ